MQTEDIKNSQDIINNIRWDLTPQIVGAPKEISSKEDQEYVTKEIESHAGYYFYIDVWNCRARLALMQNERDGSGKAETVTDLTEDIEDALVEAVEETGSTINMSSHYPINKRVKKLILLAIPELNPTNHTEEIYEAI